MISCGRLKEATYSILLLCILDIQLETKEDYRDGAKTTNRGTTSGGQTHDANDMQKARNRRKRFLRVGRIGGDKNQAV